MTTIILVRHGYSVANQQGIFAGHTNVDLSQMGYSQAKIVSDYIFNNFKIDKLYSSDLLRAVNTIQPLATTLNKNIQLESDFREIFAGDWEGMSFDDIKQRFPTEYTEWTQNTGFARCPNGESMQELQNRTYNKLLQLAKDNDTKTIVIATHAGVIRALECFLRNIPLIEMNRVAWVKNASICVLKYDGKFFDIENWNFCAYLDNLQTTLPNNI